MQESLPPPYTAWNMKPFACDLGYEGPPFTWDEERRAVLRAELDAYYAHLYGLTRKQLRYILDPHDLTDRELEDILDPAEDPPDAPRTKDFPGETFRVLKEREIKEYGEYRTQRLVLAAWNRLAQPASEKVAAPAVSVLDHEVTPIDRQVALLCRIIAAHQGAGYMATLGRVKIEKLTYLAEQKCGIDFGRMPVREAAGPADFPQLLKVLHRAKAAKIFVEQSRSNGKGYRYRPLGGFKTALDRSAQLFAQDLPQLDSLIELFVGQSTEFTESVATLYAVWNDLLAGGANPTEEEIFDGFYGWSPDKQMFRKGELRMALAFMRQEHLVPSGRGRATAARADTLAT